MDAISALTVFKIVIRIVAAFAALDTLSSSRSSQATIAWVLTLLLFPYVTLPAYLIFGRRLFRGYRKMSGRMKRMHEELVQQHRVRAESSTSIPPEDELRDYRSLQTISEAKFLGGNSVELLASGKAFFEALFSEIDKASKEILLCFYIVRDDEVGQKLKNSLIAARKRGVDVRFLYDEIGSLTLSSDYLSELRAAGVEIFDFHTRQGRWNFFQLNLRNHRKIAVVDHQVALVGGFNIGDEYLATEGLYGEWRDTQVRLRGPAVAEVELVFLSDWAWASNKRPRQEKIDYHNQGDMAVLTVATGPTDERGRCSLFFHQLFNGAKERLWIASPYLVPDESLRGALRLAILRGVDVRILIPEKPDSRLVGLATNFYLPELLREGVRVFRYKKGFLHEKVVLVDERLATIGSANLDNRSMRLNFELTMAVVNPKFSQDVREMFERDFSFSEEVKPFLIEQLPFPKRIAASVARLFSPLL